MNGCSNLFILLRPAEKSLNSVWKMSKREFDFDEKKGRNWKVRQKCFMTSQMYQDAILTTISACELCLEWLKEISA